MKKIVFTYLIALIFLTLDINAQSLRFVRTDVDSTRNGIITAGYVFGYDVYVDSLNNVSSLVMNLRFNNAQYVQYSGYKIGDYADRGEVLINLADDKVNLGGKIVTVGVFSKDDSLNGHNSPNIIHLEFVVWQNIPNGEMVFMTASNVVATAMHDSTSRQYELPSINLPLDAHGYVDVWPGDADNSGIVDSTDIVVFQHYYKDKAEELKHKRAFKRQGASTMWTAQRVLLWDIAAATYVDSDGDGIITITDGLVVFENDTKRRNIGGIINKDAKASGNEPISNDLFIPENAIKVPIYLQNGKPFKAFSAKIHIDNFSEKYEYIGTIKGDIYANYEPFISANLDKDNIELLIGSFSEAFLANGAVAYLVLVPKSINVPELVITNAQIVSTEGIRMSVDTHTDVEEHQIQNVFVSVEHTNLIIIDDNKDYDKFEIYDMLGNLIKSSKLDNYTKEDISSFNTGVYFVLLSSENKRKTIPFQYIR